MGEVADYISGSGQSSHTTYTSSQDTHIASISGSQLAFNSSNFSQVQHNNPPAAGCEELARTLQQLLAQLPERSELTDEAREEIQEAAKETLEVITSPEPKPGKVRRMIDGVVGALNRAVTALGQGALQGTTQWATENSHLLLNSLPM